MITKKQLKLILSSKLEEHGMAGGGNMGPATSMMGGSKAAPKKTKKDKKKPVGTYGQSYKEGTSYAMKEDNFPGKEARRFRAPAPNMAPSKSMKKSVKQDQAEIEAIRDRKRKARNAASGYTAGVFKENNDMEGQDVFESIRSKHPGLKHVSAKTRSAVAKKAKKGEKIGKGKFKEVEAKAAKRYGSEESGKKVAAAAM
jgi:hypothetical protein